MKPVKTLAIVVIILNQFVYQQPALAVDLPNMHRGVNTFPWVYRAQTLNNDPKSFDFNHLFPYFAAYQPANFQALLKAGADFVRAIIEPSPFLAADPDERAKLIALVMQEMRKASDQGLTVVLDLHPRESVPAWQSNVILQNPDYRLRYQATLVEFAKAITRSGRGGLVLELMNEPPGGYGWRDDYDWLGFQTRLVKAVRAVAPDLPLVVTGDRGGGIDGLLRVDVAAIDDPAIIYSFHYYEPMIVTHQGAKWTSKAWRQYISNISYPPAPDEFQPSLNRVHDAIFSDRLDDATGQSVWSEAQAALRDYFQNDRGEATIKADFSRVADWAKAHHIPPERIVLGEFGALRPGAPYQSAVNYIHDVRKAAEDDGFGWAFFNYTPFDETKQAFSLLRMTGKSANEFDPGIVTTGLGWRAP